MLPQVVCGACFGLAIFKLLIVVGDRFLLIILFSPSNLPLSFLGTHRLSVFPSPESCDHIPVCLNALVVEHMSPSAFQSSVQFFVQLFIPIVLVFSFCLPICDASSKEFCSCFESQQCDPNVCAVCDFFSFLDL